MCNNCSFTISISNISRENIHKLSNRVLDQNQNNNGIAEKLIPYSQEVLDDLELERKCNEAEKKYREEHGEYKNLRDKYPYKQLWYTWQRVNWGQKWGLCDIYLEWTDNNEEVQDCCLYGRTPWGPEEPVVQKLSEVFDCDIDYSYDEPGMGFSGILYYSKGKLVDEEEFNDAFFGHGKECPTCGCICDDENPDDWLNHEHTRCIWCEDKL